MFTSSISHSRRTSPQRWPTQSSSTFPRSRCAIIVSAARPARGVSGTTRAFSELVVPCFRCATLPSHPGGFSASPRRQPESSRKMNGGAM
jgi:hypothetical protein